jgi:hypothetical protein
MFAKKTRYADQAIPTIRTPPRIHIGGLPAPCRAPPLLPTFGSLRTQIAAEVDEKAVVTLA